jgi:hypothetical protein
LRDVIANRRDRSLTPRGSAVNRLARARASADEVAENSFQSGYARSGGKLHDRARKRAPRALPIPLRNRALGELRLQTLVTIVKKNYHLAWPRFGEH